MCNSTFVVVLNLPHQPPPLQDSTPSKSPTPSTPTTQPSRPNHLITNPLYPKLSGGSSSRKLESGGLFHRFHPHLSHLDSSSLSTQPATSVAPLVVSASDVKPSSIPTKSSTSPTFKVD